MKITAEAQRGIDKAMSEGRATERQGAKGRTTSAGKPKRPARKTIIHDALWRAHGIPIPEQEYPFHDKRKWRFDYAWRPYLFFRGVALEIQGGLFTHGRHTRGAALVSEYQKLNEAQLLGWVVLLVTPQQVKDGSVFELVRRALA